MWSLSTQCKVWNRPDRHFQNCLLCQKRNVKVHHRWLEVVSIYLRKLQLSEELPPPVPHVPENEQIVRLRRNLCCCCCGVLFESNLVPSSLQILRVCDPAGNRQCFGDVQMLSGVVTTTTWDTVLEYILYRDLSCNKEGLSLVFKLTKFQVVFCSLCLHGCVKKCSDNDASNKSWIEVFTNPKP